MNQEKQYINILEASMKKKEDILNELFSITHVQEEYLKGDVFEMDVFDDMMNTKEQLIKELNAVDDSFEINYERVRQYLKDYKKELKSDIVILQNSVRNITKLSVKLQAMEERNKKRFESVVIKKK